MNRVSVVFKLTRMLKHDIPGMLQMLLVGQTGGFFNTKVNNIVNNMNAFLEEYNTATETYPKLHPK